MGTADKMEGAAFANDGSFLEMMLKMQAEQGEQSGEKEEPKKEKEDEKTREFKPSAKYAGSKKGYIFQMGPKGVGYYPDPMLKDEKKPSEKRCLPNPEKPRTQGQQ